MPLIDVLVELLHWLHLRFKSSDVFLLHALHTLKDIFDLYFVRWKRAPIRPVASDTVDDEIIGEFRYGQRKVDIRLRVKLISHIHTIDSKHFERRRKCQIKTSGANKYICFVESAGVVDRPFRRNFHDLVVNWSYICQRSADINNENIY